jgi:hypothetical protein
MNTKIKSIWTITIVLAKDTVKMTFTDRAMAEQELARIKAQSIFGGKWITSIELT